MGLILARWVGLENPGRFLRARPQNRHRVGSQIIYCAAGFSGYVVGMDWQQSVSLCIVAAAAVGLVGSKLRRRRLRFDQAGHCGCSTVVGSSSSSSIVFRARKGKRPEVLVKMR